MCRANVAPQAADLLASLLDDVAHQLAAAEGVPRDQVLIGPVDFGEEDPS